ncbi:MAG TPA: 4-hydroxy-tetrahydrodipicolinate reductase, partial [Microthrixaceae bacterium]|nr:4-hydroxy-tetrahydrodipicolinate reductase [Microthrixaceae bacterium]
RMGAAVCAAVSADEGLELVAAVDPSYRGLDLRTVTGVDSDLKISGEAVAFDRTGTEVVVDFSHHDASVDNLSWLAAHGIHAVVGTTGFSDEEIARCRGEFTSSNCVIAPNFAIGAVLMMHFAATAAPFFESAEIIELHHDAKIDAPSGTALLTAQRMAEASSDWTSDPTKAELIEGARGGEGPAGIRVHSLRIKGLVAHQEVILGTTGQTLTIRHDSMDRSSFMPGVLLAVKQVQDMTGVTIGLDKLLGL